MRGSTSLEAMVILIGAILSVSLISAYMIHTLGTTTGTASKISTNVNETFSSQVQIISAVSVGRDTLVFVKGLLGYIPLDKITLLVNGLPTEFKFKEYKGDGDSVLERGEEFFLWLPESGDKLDLSISFGGSTIQLGVIRPERTSFRYKRVIQVTNTGPEIHNYQLRVELNSSNTNLAHLSSTCGDLRAYDSSGNPIPLWVETCSSTRVIFFVKLSDVPSESNIYLYYGAGDLPLFQDGSQVFDFFDDFKDLDAWTCTGVGCDAVFTTDFDGYSVLHLGDSATSSVILYRPISLPQEDNIYLEARFRLEGTPNDLDFYWGLDDDPTPYQQLGSGPGDRASGQYHACVVDESIATRGSVYTSNTWAVDSILRTSSTVYCTYLGETLSATGTPGPFDYLDITFDPDSTSRIIYIDWIRVRKYDPNISYTLGDEEEGSFTP